MKRDWKRRVSFKKKRDQKRRVSFKENRDQKGTVSFNEGWLKTTSFFQKKEVCQTSSLPFNVWSSTLSFNISWNSPALCWDLPDHHDSFISLACVWHFEMQRRCQQNAGFHFFVDYVAKGEGNFHPLKWCYLVVSAPRWAPTIANLWSEITPRSLGLSPKLPIYKTIYRSYNSIYI